MVVYVEPESFEYLKVWLPNEALILGFELNIDIEYIATSQLSERLIGGLNLQVVL